MKICLLLLCSLAGFLFLSDAAAQPGLNQKVISSPFKTANGSFGSTIAAAGDVNNDGQPDFMVGGIAEETATSPDGAGLVHGFSNNGDSVLFTLGSPNPYANGWFGYAIDAAGDVNKDNHDDVIISARNENPGSSPKDAGRV